MKLSSGLLDANITSYEIFVSSELFWPWFACNKVEGDESLQYKQIDVLL